MKTCVRCGYVAKSQGALNLHNYHCKYKNGNVKEVKEYEEKQEPCNHSWRLLNNSGVEKSARQHGFHEVCIQCQEVQ